MATAENAHKPPLRESAPRIDLSKAFGSASAKKNKNKNKNKANISTPSSRQPMVNHNRLSGHAIPLGLLSPPASQTNVLSGGSESEHGGLDQHSVREQDPARLLISPPPEEELIASRRSSFHKPSTSHLNNTTNSIASPSTKFPQPKRKRSMAPTLSYSGSNSSEGSTAAVQPASGTGPLATPNPKPRKQSRKSNRAHVRTPSDVSMESPTRAFSMAEKQANPSSPAVRTPTRKRSSYQLMRSPHTNNPNADYIPPFRPAANEEATDIDDDLLWTQTRKPARMGRRSATPVVIPPYEPPAVVFTPPREVVLSPITSVTKSRQKRKAGKGLKLDIQVKKEPPVIDLSAPMPPASPTDDPLLLSGPPEEDLTATPSRSRVMRDASVFTNHALEQSTTAAPEIPRQRESLPPSSPPAPNDSSSPSRATYRWQNTGVYANNDESSDSMDLDMQPHEYADVEGPIPFFFPAAGSWSDSDDDDIRDSPHTPVRETGVIDQGIGEFTGRWHMTKVRTKADPPSSATRMRIEDWGKPISPYPYPVSRPSSGAGVRLDSTSPSPSLRPRTSTHEAGEAEKTTLGSEVVEEGEGDDTATIKEESMSVEHRTGGTQEVEIQPDDEDQAEEEEQEEQEVRALSLPPEQEDSEEEEEEVRRLSLEPEEEEDNHDLEEQEEPEDREPEPSRTDNSGAAHSASTSQPPFRLHSREAPVSSPPLRNLSFLRSSNQTRGSLRTSDPVERAKELFGVRSSPLKPSSALAEEVSDDEDHEMEPANELRIAKPTEQEQEMVEEEVALVDEDEAEMSSGDESDPTVEDPGLVQITSSDPKAAARAAAILKQHDYDCFTKIVLKQQEQHRRKSFQHSTVDELKRDNRRKTLAGSGVVKGKARASPRRSLGTVIGDKVYIPGSPVTTLGGLLEEAEKTVQSEQLKGLTPQSPFEENALVGMALGERDPFHTPQASKFGSGSRPRSSLVHEVVDGGDVNERSSKEWTKDDWKILDGCFTDERIELASRMQSESLLTMEDEDEEIPLAGVDLVDVDDVVRRFMTEIGGEETTDAYGWSRESLVARAKAIQNKQRAGNVAPPTTPYTPRTVSKTREPRPTNMQVPDLTPLGRRPFPAARKPVSLPPPAGPAAPFSTIPDNIQEPPPRRKVPATLLAPRYSHLLDEAVAISRELPSPEQPLTSVNDDTPPIAEPSLKATSSQPPEAPAQRPRGLGRLFSYIPGLSKSSAPTRKPTRESRPGLPLPPAEVLEKPRGPISTPARPPVPKAKAPKELVNLNHQPVPEPKLPSMIPRPKPQRLVELNPVGLPEEYQQVVEPVRPRRSSGGSVKDLVKDFEKRRESLEADSHQLTKARSIGNLRKGGEGRPIWKP
ncbi:hypothetical protein BT96DRAFT_919592 [Gymnopus androsaceus JB14]|uniref:Uncharacterized protein n=1 Tax=Gymnopus androsaceus JB14 TaxID=1447944 RepID=A0A6A4HQC9_9AGAR|nr:hypothetical protein BT96DRAFT_919592 [Gymnopus androsaceus JB14]